MQNKSDMFGIPTRFGKYSLIRLTAGNGYGSVGGTIRRFSTILESYGPDITYIDDPANGGSFTINTDGIYSIYYQDIRSASACRFGVSINATASEQNIAVDSIASARILGYTDTSAAATGSSLTFIQLLKAGDIIRAHAYSTSPDGSGVATRFTIAKVL